MQTKNNKEKKKKKKGKEERKKKKEKKKKSKRKKKEKMGYWRSRRLRQSGGAVSYTHLLKELGESQG